MEYLKNLNLEIRCGFCGSGNSRAFVPKSLRLGFLHGEAHAGAEGSRVVLSKDRGFCLRL